jgi:hypothetical protein
MQTVTEASKILYKGDFTAEIDSIMRNFNFRRVKKIMGILNWTWVSVENNGIPETIDIKKLARRLLKDIEAYPSNEYCSTSTGGLKAWKHGNDIGLEFVVESWETNKGIK